MEGCCFKGKIQLTMISGGHLPLTWAEVQLGQKLENKQKNQLLPRTKSSGKVVIFPPRSKGITDAEGFKNEALALG